MAVEFTNPMGMVAFNNMLNTGYDGAPMNLAQAMAAQDSQREQARVEELQRALPILLAEVDINDLPGSMARLSEKGIDQKNIGAVIELKLKMEKENRLKQGQDMQRQVLERLPGFGGPQGNAGAPADDAELYATTGAALALSGGEGGDELMRLANFKKDQANRAQDTATQGDKTRFEQENKLSDDFYNRTKKMIIVRDALQNLRTAAKADTGAGDIQMVFAFMKAQDPDSAVREGEFATAENSAGIPERIRTQYNRVLNGERLSPKQRENFLSLGEANYKKTKMQFDKTKGAFAKRAQRYKLDPANVTFDLETAEPELELIGGAKEPSGNAPEGAAEPPAPNARKAPDGNWYVLDPDRPGKYLMVQP